MLDPKKTAIIILAAGESSRMHGLKQLLPWGNTTILGNAIHVAFDSEADHVYVVLGAETKKIQSKIQSDSVKWIFNKNWKEGMGSSIACAMDYILDTSIKFKGVLFMLCDQPLIHTQYLNDLMQTFDSGQKGNIATRYGNRAGVPVFFGNKHFEALTKLDGDYGAKMIIEKNMDDTIILDAGEILTDLDTKAEYESMLNKLKNQNF